MVEVSGYLWDLLYLFFLSQIDNIGFQVNLVKGIFIALLRDNNWKIDKKNWQKINSHGKKYIRFKWIRLDSYGFIRLDLREMFFNYFSEDLIAVVSILAFVNTFIRKVIVLILCWLLILNDNVACICNE